MENVNVLLLFSRWVHIGAAIVAIGGATFVRFVLIPAAAQSLDEERHHLLRQAVHGRWARIVHVSIGLLLVTGAFNFLTLAMPPKVDPVPYHPVFGVKFLAALVVFFLASALASRGPGFASLRRSGTKWLTVIVVLAGVVILLSGLLGQFRTRQGTPSSTAVNTSGS